MPFQKGDNRINRDGRPPGKPQSDIKQAYKNLIEDNLPKVTAWLNDVAKDNPAKALEFILKLSEFIIPKMKATEITDTSNSEINQLSEEDFNERLERARLVLGEMPLPDREARIAELKQKLLND